MLVLDFAIPGGIIGVLRLFVLLVPVSVGNVSEYFVVRQQKEIVRRRRDVALRRATAADVVRVLGNGLKDGTERRR